MTAFYNNPFSYMPVPMFGKSHILLLLALLLLPATAQAETKEEWIALGARVHGGFGPFIPVGIRIGIDALQRLNAPRHEVIVTYYDAGLPPCPCIADGIMIATQATPAQKMMIFSPDKPPDEFMAVIEIKNRKTNEAVRYSIAKEWHAKILSWRALDPSGRYDAGMSAEGLFQVEPVK
jgi:formylmethanofuran dehydrogenase subunit E